MTVDEDGQPQRVTSRDLWIALTRMETKLDGLVESNARMDRNATDLEQRVRVLETVQAAQTATSPVKEGLSVRMTGWGTVVAVIASWAALIVALIKKN